MSECMLAMQSDAPVRLAAASPEIVLGDPKANVAAAISAIRRAEKAEADYLVLPELFLCGATLGSLMEHPLMLNACREALGAVAEATKHTWLFVSIGLPYMVDGRVRSCIALLRGGRIYAVIPASRGAVNPFGFAPAVPRGAASLSTLTPIPRLSVGFAGQIFAKGEPREGHIMLLSGAINATAKSYGAVRSSLAAYSARTGMAAAMALPSRGESTTAFVFDGYCAIAANGEILAESEPLSRDAFVYADVCIDKLSAFEPFTEAEEAFRAAKGGACAQGGAYSCKGLCYRRKRGAGQRACAAGGVRGGGRNGHRPRHDNRRIHAGLRHNKPHQEQQPRPC